MTPETTTDLEPLTEDETACLNLWAMWGSDGYPIRKFRNGRWLVEGYRGCGAFPVVYRTKREAVAQWQRYIHLLIERSGAEAQRRYFREHPEDSPAPTTETRP